MKRVEKTHSYETFKTSDDPLFTILTATHNCADYVEQAIKSVQSQSHKNWEMIIVDDCSSDGTYTICEKIATTDPRIKLFKNTSQIGCSSTYKLALENASGEICGVLDGDDTLDPKAIEIVIRVYKKYPKLGFLYTQSWWCNKNLFPKRKGLSAMPDRGVLLLMGMKRRHAFSHWRTFRTCLRKRTTLFEPGLMAAVDKSLGYALEEVAYGAFLDKPLYYYRYHPSNLSHRIKQRDVWSRIVSKAVERRKQKRIIPKGVTRVTEK